MQTSEFEILKEQITKMVTNFTKRIKKEGAKLGLTLDVLVHIQEEKKP